MIAAAVGLVILSGAGVSYFIWRSLLTPLGLYSAIWAATLFGCSLAPLLRIELVDISPETWYSIIAGWVMFLLGCAAAAVSLGRPKTVPPLSGSSRKRVDVRRLKRYVRSLVTLGASGVILKIALVAEKFGGLTTALYRVGEFKVQSLATGQDPFPAVYNLLVFFLYPAVVFTVVGITRNARGLRRWLFAEMALFAANDLTFASRGTTVSAFLIALVTYNLCKHPGRRSLSATGVAKAAVAGFAILLTIEFAHAVREGVELDPASYVYDSLINPFFYLVGSIPACSEVRLDRLSNGYPAAYTFGGLYRAASVLGSAVGVGFNWPTPPKPYVSIPLPFNTYPQICLLEADFGPLGAQLVMFILGFTFTSIHEINLRARSLAPLVLDACCLAYVLVTPRDEMSFWMSFWFVLLLTPLLIRRLELESRPGLQVIDPLTARENLCFGPSKRRSAARV